MRRVWAEVVVYRVAGRQCGWCDASAMSPINGSKTVAECVRRMVGELDSASLSGSGVSGHSRSDEVWFGCVTAVMVAAGDCGLLP